MDIVQISSKFINFNIPSNIYHCLTLTNLTLRPLLVRTLISHSYEILVNPSEITIQAFQQAKIEVILNWNQSALNYCSSMLRFYLYQIYDENDKNQFFNMLNDQQNLKHLNIKINININKNFFVVKQINKECKQYYFLKKVIPFNTKPIINGQHQPIKQLKQGCFKFLDTLAEVQAIYSYSRYYVIQIIHQQNDICTFYEQWYNNQLHCYVLGKIIKYGTQSIIPNSVNIIPKQIKPSNLLQQNYDQLLNEKQQFHEQINNQKQMINSEQEQNKDKNNKLQKYDYNKYQNCKKSFFINNEDIFTFYRGSKSLQFQHNNKNNDISINSIIKQQYRREIRIENKINNKKQEQKIIDYSQQILNYIVQTKQNYVYIYLLFSNKLIRFQANDITKKYIIQFDGIDKENIKLPCPMILLHDKDVIFANQCYLYWMKIKKKNTQWKYVQRKQIYCLCIINQLNIIIVGGKNFSKLSYIGKSTNRSNIKLYGCNDKKSNQLNHLYTYDIIGEDIGSVKDLYYINTSPNNVKLLMVRTQSQKRNMLHFIRIKAFDQLINYRSIDINEIGLQNIISMKYNSDTNRIIIMQNINNLNCFKKIKIKSQYQKIQLNTKCITMPLLKYTSFSIGGIKNKQFKQNNQNKQWIAAIQENKCQVQLLYLKNRNLFALALGKGDIQNFINSNSGQYYIVYTNTTIRIRYNY